MKRPGELTLLLIDKPRVAKKDEEIKPDTVRTISLKIIDTNEYECTDGHCSKCFGKERKVYKVKAPGRKPPYTFICPEGHNVHYNFIND